MRFCYSGKVKQKVSHDAENDRRPDIFQHLIWINLDDTVLLSTQSQSVDEKIRGSSLNQIRLYTTVFFSTVFIPHNVFFKNVPTVTIWSLPPQQHLLRYGLVTEGTIVCFRNVLWGNICFSFRHFIHPCCFSSSIAIFLSYS